MEPESPAASPGIRVRDSAQREVEAEVDVEVAAIDAVAHGVLALTLRAAAGEGLPAWDPGAHVDVLLPNGQVRQYSLCGDRNDLSSYRIAVLREPESRGGSRYIHEQLGVGDHLVLRGPRNHFELAPADRYLFIAGGIGITPILPMIAQADEAGAEWRLLYGGRTRRSMAFRDELLEAYDERVTLVPQDESGLLDLASALRDSPSDTLVYCCGPEPLLHAVEELCRPWPGSAPHVERFSPRAQQSGPEDDQEFEVILQSSGQTVRIPSDKSILETLEAQGISIMSSCLEGTCGTCELAVLDGVPDHRDSVLSAAEREAGKTMMICVSRSKTPRLVLEL